MMPKPIRPKKQRPSTRKVNRREKLKKFLIVCEGKRTEPFYFEAFRFKVSITLRVEGLGYNTISLVREAIQLMSQDEYDQVWCVFDRDSFPAQNFNNALSLAKSAGINVAYSNEAFEIWYLLHFHYHDSATSRDLYKEMLTKRLGIEYRKNDPNMYERLKEKQQAAIDNAKKLRSSYVPHSPEKDNPCTTVHHLVKELNKFAV